MGCGFPLAALFILMAAGEENDEIRNTKSETNPNDQNTKSKTRLLRCARNDEGCDKNNLAP